MNRQKRSHLQSLLKTIEKAPFSKGKELLDFKLQEFPTKPKTLALLKSKAQMSDSRAGAPPMTWCIQGAPV